MTITPGLSAENSWYGCKGRRWTMYTGVHGIPQPHVSLHGSAPHQASVSCLHCDNSCNNLVRERWNIAHWLHSTQMHFSNISNTTLTRWKVAGRQLDLFSDTTEFDRARAQQQCNRKARISSNLNSEIRKQTTCTFFPGLSIDLWSEGVRAHPSETWRSTHTQMHERPCLVLQQPIISEAAIYETNHAFYVTVVSVTLFGETVEPATPFRVVFN